MNNFNKFVLLFFITPCIGINEEQNIQFNLYNNCGGNISRSEWVSVPVKCNCFTTNKKCIQEINKKIKLNYLVEYQSELDLLFEKNNYQKLIKMEHKCLNLNGTNFTYHYYLSNRYCSRFRLIFSISFIIFNFVLGIVLYRFHKRDTKRYLYQRLMQFDKENNLDEENNLDNDSNEEHSIQLEDFLN